MVELVDVDGISTAVVRKNVAFHVAAMRGLHKFEIRRDVIIQISACENKFVHGAVLN